jgi:hypothetical protein
LERPVAVFNAAALACTSRRAFEWADIYDVAADVDRRNNRDRITTASSDQAWHHRNKHRHHHPDELG